MKAKRDKRISMFCEMVANLIAVETAKEIAGINELPAPPSEVFSLVRALGRYSYPIQLPLYHQN